ncbi:MAG: DUF4924 family protein [Fulvivirga sp.]|nr:DUF4924 family protein [Fulvivirga sp.]
MILAETKKRNNISEYIIYMYQTEDLIRVYNFDMEKINEYVIKHIPIKDKTELIAWYAHIAAQMKKEGIEEKGHLKMVQKVVQSLSQLKEELLKKDKAFKQIYKKAHPYIQESLDYAQGVVTDEIQACINGIYGLLLSRMEGKKVPDELMESINTFGDVLSYLSYKYKQKHFLRDN